MSHGSSSTRVSRTAIVQQHRFKGSLSSPLVATSSFRHGNQLIFNWARFVHVTQSCHKEIIPFKLSDIGEGIKEVTLKEWFVKEGDKVNQFDQICEVQSDKASVTITSRYDGIINKIHYQVDDIALVGSALVDIEIVESEKPPEEQEIQEGDAIQVGRSEESFHLPSQPLPLEKALAAPAVRRIAAEYKIDLKNVQGTGKDGRVLKEDILNYISSKENVTTSEQPAAAASTTPGPPAPQPSSPATPAQTPSPAAIPFTPRSITAPSDRKEAIKGYTRTMIKTMTAANEIPHFGYCEEINVTELINLRRRLKDVADQYNIKLTMMPLFLKSASLALSQYPILNSTLDVASDSIIYKGAHNIGVAMDTKLGLIVPNVKNVESKSILEIATDLQNLHKSAQGGSIKPDDIRGGTFTISNIGSIGGTYAKPVILPPEVAIVAIGRVQTLPRFDKAGNVVPAQMINISFSADHRLIDGATAARFCNLWKSYLEDPASMLLHLK
ncbi:Lipoamide acyltransferase component of branched-chain alpha-keto acid dehydrogenase complex, mitochondrial [Orchesella cincta]|uniref:Dihydrolipoamide acetyltransferase component of pyruvate dehydrogenase complex n=1 Tax=Orchesella cincta TaxID=48709 RepID=A0A1D2N315_ORCCI|nr:Lipoamide acyltransferase component of branched-chain alpha-keto acid dehydrogenase complex, mitochondrial [Orchesella cincta]